MSPSSKPRDRSIEYRVATLARQTMEAAAYGMEAGLFYSKSISTKSKSLVFQRFMKAADAIRFAVEELPSKGLIHCSLEVNETHYFGLEIRPLYDSADFPLRRRAIKSVAH